MQIRLTDINCSNQEVSYDLVSNYNKNTYNLSCLKASTCIKYQLSSVIVFKKSNNLEGKMECVYRGKILVVDKHLATLNSVTK